MALFAKPHAPQLQMPHWFERLMFVALGMMAGAAIAAGVALALDGNGSAERASAVTAVEPSPDVGISRADPTGFAYLADNGGPARFVGVDPTGFDYLAHNGGAAAAVADPTGFGIISNNGAGAIAPQIPPEAAQALDPTGSYYFGPGPVPRIAPLVPFEAAAALDPHGFYYFGLRPD